MSGSSGPAAAPAIVPDGTWRDLSPPLWGYNAANLFYNVSGSEAGLRSMLAEMGTRVLRFPGGTLANFYHPDEKGYGLQQADVELVKGTNMYKSMSRSVQREKAAGNGVDPLEGMIALAKATGVSVLYVANIFSGTDQEVLGVLRRLKNAGVAIAGVELGNEHYLRAYQRKFPDVQSYLKRAEVTAKAVRNEFPSIPLGIIVAPPPELKGAQGDNAERIDDWNARAAASTFADALVLHTYAMPKGCDEAGGEAALFTCMNASSIDYSQSRLPIAIQDLASLGGGRKPVWITEWNLHAVFEHFGNTLLQGLFAADMMLHMSTMSGISISTCHNLLADGDGFNAISINGGAGGFSGQVLYHVSSMLKGILVPGAKIISCRIKDDGFAGSTVDLLQLPNGSRYLVVNARSGRALSLAGTQLPPDMPIEATGVVLGADDLLEGVGANPVRSSGGLAPRTMTLPDVRSAELPPYALAVFRLGT